MPFHSLERPSIGIGTLISTLRQREVAADAAYFNLVFASILGVSLYQNLCGMTASHHNHLFPLLTGEWSFSQHYYERKDYEIEKFVEKILEGNASKEAIEDLLNARSKNSRISRGVLFLNPMG